MVKKVTADTIDLVGKKNRVEVQLTKATGEDWQLVSMMAEMSSCFALSENERLGMSVHGVLMASGLVELDDIYHICEISYKEEEGQCRHVLLLPKGAYSDRRKLRGGFECGPHPYPHRS